MKSKPPVGGSKSPLISESSRLIESFKDGFIQERITVMLLRDAQQMLWLCLEWFLLVKSRKSSQYGVCNISLLITFVYWTVVKKKLSHL